MPRTSKLLAWVVAALLVVAAAARAEPAGTLADGRTGKIEFETITPISLTQLIRRGDAPRTTVFGTLHLPPRDGKVPAMVIAHGSGGVSEAREGRWADRLNAIGIAAFVVDSFTPRGIRETATDQGQLSPAANVADGLFALRLLATHPRIDVNRIGVMGFSRGGRVAIETALEPVRRGVIDDALRFAVHVPLYPPCNSFYVSEHVTGAPILFMLAGADDYTPITPCARYVDWFRSHGVTADSIVYDAAYHGFDGLGAPRFLRNLQTGRNCDVRVDLDRLEWRRLDTDTVMRSGAEIAAYYRGCMARGATVGGNDQAARKAAADLAAYLTRVFGL